MSEPGRKTVLITGASSGIGKATALYLGQRGYRVAATGRDLSRLDGLVSEAGPGAASFSTYRLDVTDPSEGAQDPRSPYYDYLRRLGSRAAGRVRWEGDPAKVARTIGKALATRHPRHRYQVGADALLGTLAARLLPDTALEYLIARVAGR